MYVFKFCQNYTLNLKRTRNECNFCVQTFFLTDVEITMMINWIKNGKGEGGRYRLSESRSILEKITHKKATLQKKLQK